MKKLWLITIVSVICGLCSCTSPTTKPVKCSAVNDKNLTYIDLLNQLTDLEHLAILPPPGQKCQQWSSYDRNSKYDQASGKYINWSANRDGSGIIRKENGELVFAEMKGPGVIWRIWSARAQDGPVSIYLDGSDKPAIELPFKGYFNRKNEPFIYSALVHETASGINCYLPIPYQKSCKITAKGKWGRYYHFAYTTYPEGTRLPTFNRQLTKSEILALTKANDILANCGTDPAGTRAGQITDLKTVEIAPGSTETVTCLKGPRAITALKVRLDLPQPPEDRDLLRELTLSIYWDGQDKPSVWSPLGDFFGTAPGANNYKSLPMGITEDGFYSYWYMPFDKSAVIRLTNEGNQFRKVKFTITYAPLSRPIKQLGRFHAKWHRDEFLPDDAERKAIDWTMLKTQGKGRYCGVMLHVWNPKGGWWGEGDEKFFVDGEKFPSTYGTGSEDYFGYAWCNPRLFTNCYHNQTFNTGDNKGHISVNRWHITDNVPFQSCFEAAIEKYYPNANPTLYASVAYWYQAAGQTDPYQPVPVQQRIEYYRPIKPLKVEGALEAEELELVGPHKRGAAWQSLDSRWSGEAQLRWYSTKPGRVLDILVPVDKTGKYRLKAQFTKKYDYGIVQLYLDGNKLGEPIDLYSADLMPTGVLDLGIHELAKGNHILKAEIIGANDKATKRYRFGMDYLLFEKIE